MSDRVAVLLREIVIVFALCFAIFLPIGFVIGFVLGPFPQWTHYVGTVVAIPFEIALLHRVLRRFGIDA